MKQLDERGKACPLPVLEAKQELENGTEEMIRVLVDNEIAVQNLKKMADHKGYSFRDEKDGAAYAVILGRSGAAEAAPGAAAAKEAAGASAKADTSAVPAGNTVVVIASDGMGEPEKELGKILLKGFLYSLAHAELLPDVVLFYNGGAKLTTADSPVLEDLKLLDQVGVKLLTCGTCMKFQNLGEKPAVGGVTNMYEITETMLHAARLIRP